MGLNFFLFCRQGHETTGHADALRLLRRVLSCQCTGGIPVSSYMFSILYLLAFLACLLARLSLRCLSARCIRLSYLSCNASAFALHSLRLLLLLRVLHFVTSCDGIREPATTTGAFLTFGHNLPVDIAAFFCWYVVSFVLLLTQTYGRKQVQTKYKTHLFCNSLINSTLQSAFRTILNKHLN